MNKVFSFLIAALMLFCLGCGSKKSPTGGKIDLVKPELSATLPSEFSDISGGKIELTFSKDLDKASVTRGLYIYPLIDNKSISVDGNRVMIRIREKLLKDTNYFVTLTPRIKDLRDNPLAKSQTLVFASGELQTSRLAGLISYELPADQGKQVDMTLYSADALPVMAAQFTGTSYALENLNPAEYTWNAYIDNNANGRYDQDTDPFAKGKIDLERMATVDIPLAYVDSTAVLISSVSPVSSTEIRLRFSEKPASIGSMLIYNKAGAVLPIVGSDLDETDLTIATQAGINEAYTLELRDVKDFKGNLSKQLQIDYQGSPVTDRKAPLILGSTPRNGTSVNTESPVLTVVFDEIMDPRSLTYSLTTADGKSVVPIRVEMQSGKIAKFRAEQKLQKNKEYTLTIGQSCSDGAGNKLSSDQRISFMVLLGS